MLIGPAKGGMIDDGVEPRVGCLDPYKSALDELPRGGPAIAYGSSECRAAHSAGSKVSEMEFMQ